MAWLVHYPPGHKTQEEREEAEPLAQKSLTGPGYYHLHLCLRLLMRKSSLFITQDKFIYNFIENTTLAL